MKILKEKKDKKILDKFSSYNDFILKKYQVEIFISQQVNKIYLTIITLNPDLILPRKLFNVSLYINCKGKSKEELDLLTKKVEAELNAIMIMPNIPYFRQSAGYKAMIPIAKDELKVKRNITTDALSAFFPFTSPFLDIDEDGVMLGLNKNKVPVIKDIYSLSNGNGVILASSGSGKSYYSKL